MPDTRGAAIIIRLPGKSGGLSIISIELRKQLERETKIRSDISFSSCNSNAVVLLYQQHEQNRQINTREHTRSAFRIRGAFANLIGRDACSQCSPKNKARAFCGTASAFG